MALPVTQIIPPTAYVFVVSQDTQPIATAGSLDRAMTIARDEIETYAPGETVTWTEHMVPDPHHGNRMSWWYNVPHQGTPRSFFSVERWVVEW